MIILNLCSKQSLIYLGFFVCYNLCGGNMLEDIKKYAKENNVPIKVLLTYPITNKTLEEVKELRKQEAQQKARCIRVHCRSCRQRKTQSDD